MSASLSGSRTTRLSLCGGCEGGCERGQGLVRVRVQSLGSRSTGPPAAANRQSTCRRLALARSLAPTLPRPRPCTHLGERPVLAPERVARAPEATMWVLGSYLSACSYSSGTLRWGGEGGGGGQGVDVRGFHAARSPAHSPAAAAPSSIKQHLYDPCPPSQRKQQQPPPPPEVVVDDDGLQADVAHLVKHLLNHVGLLLLGSRPRPRALHGAGCADGGEGGWVSKRQWRAAGGRHKVGKEQQ